jgi:hypothetical protein
MSVEAFSNTVEERKKVTYLECWAVVSRDPGTWLGLGVDRTKESELA